MYSHVTTLTFTVTYEKIELLKGHLLSFVVSYHLFVFFNNANTVSAEMWVWVFGNHAWYKTLVKSLVLEISKSPYSHILLTVFSQCFSFTPQANFTVIEGDGIESSLPIKMFSTLISFLLFRTHINPENVSFDRVPLVTHFSLSNTEE